MVKENLPAPSAPKANLPARAAPRPPRRFPRPPSPSPSPLLRQLLKGKMETPPQRSPKRPALSESGSNKLDDVGPSEPKLHGSTSNVGTAESRTSKIGARLDIILKRLVKDNKMKADVAKRVMEYVCPEKSDRRCPPTIDDGMDTVG